MTDGSPAPLTPAERVVLVVSAQVLRSAAQRLRAEWDLFGANFPDRAQDAERGFLMAVHRVESMAAAMEKGDRDGHGRGVDGRGQGG